MELGSPTKLTLGAILTVKFLVAVLKHPEAFATL